MHWMRTAAAAALVIGSIGLAGPAMAAAPANDTWPLATELTDPLPVTVTQSTVGATTDDIDAELNTSCGAPATGASVWFSYTAQTDGGLVVDTSASDYSTGVLIAAGGPGAWELLSCAPVATGWTASAGTTYSIMVFNDTVGGSGGNLALTLATAPAPPQVDISVDPVASFNSRTGEALVSGRVTCTPASDDSVQFAFLEVQLTQRVGRVLISGYGGTDLTCDGSDRPWSMIVAGSNGLFKGGKAASLTIGQACGIFDCGIDFEERTVQLKGSKKRG